jgi:hypothetical protein
MPASSMAASISEAALAPFWARMNVYWASKLTYISSAPSSASSQIANAITRRGVSLADRAGADLAAGQIRGVWRRRVERCRRAGLAGATFPAHARAGDLLVQLGQ